MGKEFLPFVQFNYLGYSSDVSTIAHELGHAIYSSYSKDNQESIYAEPIIFTQEVASTTNELLYYSYMMEHAATEDERMFYLENMLSTRPVPVCESSGPMDTGAGHVYGSLSLES